MNTSISDNNEYPLFCEQAAINENLFSVFKSQKTYTDILEHVTFEEGNEYIKLFSKNKTIIDNLEKFSINDTQGTPRVYKYNIGIFSPTTLRYIKILSDLSQLDLNNLNIVEIGAGYGGQYTTIRQLFKPKKYTFVDLPPVNKLISKYVNNLKFNDIPLDFYDINNLLEISADLVISNYAFSECTTNIQDIYINKIIKNCKHGYMLYNNMQGYNHIEFIPKIDKKVKIFAEIPNTHPKNVLLTW